LFVFSQCAHNLILAFYSLASTIEVSVLIISFHIGKWAAVLIGQKLKEMSFEGHSS